MRTLVQFIVRIEPGLYGLAALGIFLSIRNFVIARRSRRVAVFPLEREAADNRQRRALTTILALLLLSSGVYIIANIVGPNMILATTVPTPTPIFFMTQQPSPTPARVLYPTITPTSGLPPGVDATLAPPQNPVTNGCELLGAKITSPTPNQTVTGQVVVRGQANIINFAQYKFEIKGGATGNAWVVVGTSTVPVLDGVLGTWDSTSLPPGSYVLRMVVSRPDGSYATPCEVPITIVGPGGATGPTPTP